MAAPVILALDLATQFGFCVGAVGDLQPEMGSESLRTSSTHDGAKLCMLSDWLWPMLQKHRPARVVFEAPFMTSSPKKDGKAFGNPKTMLTLLGMANVVDMLTYRMDIRSVHAASQSARKSFVGHGRPEDPKQAVMDECHRRGWEPVDHNAGDAAALWNHTCLLYFPAEHRVSYRK